MAMQINKESGYEDKEIRNIRGSGNLSHDTTNDPSLPDWPWKQMPENLS
jgi:hypothetical protein